MFSSSFSYISIISFFCFFSNRKINFFWLMACPIGDGPFLDILSNWGQIFRNIFYSFKRSVPKWTKCPKKNRPQLDKMSQKGPSPIGHYSFLCFTASYITIPADTEAFSDVIFPFIGIFTKKSQFFFTFSLIPCPSFPITTPSGPVRSWS